jgi:hypothetical protein
MKLEYYKENKHERHIRDITSMLRVSGEMIDRAYLAQWAGPLDVVYELQKVLESSREQPPTNS